MVALMPALFLALTIAALVLHGWGYGTEPLGVVLAAMLLYMAGAAVVGAWRWWR